MLYDMRDSESAQTQGASAVTQFGVANMMQLRAAYHLVVFIAPFGFESSLANAAPAVNAKKEVVGVTTRIFVAARANDLPALVAITTPDFYAYDGGKRFTAQTLMELIKKLHAAGKHYEWNGP
jgi:hypothetical protein